MSLNLSLSLFICSVSQFPTLDVAFSAEVFGDEFLEGHQVRRDMKESRQI
jgi:hypothetical protein